MIFKLLQFPIRSYRPSVSPVHQEKILAIRSELAAIGIATGRSRADRNGFTGIEGIDMKQAIERLREFDLKFIEEKNKEVIEGDNEGEAAANSSELKKKKKQVVFTHNSLIINVKVKLLKEQ